MSNESGFQFPLMQGATAPSSKEQRVAAAAERVTASLAKKSTAPEMLQRPEPVIEPDYDQMLPTELIADRLRRNKHDQVLAQAQLRLDEAGLSSGQSDARNVIDAFNKYTPYGVAINNGLAFAKGAARDIANVANIGFNAAATTNLGGIPDQHIEILEKRARNEYLDKESRRRQVKIQGEMLMGTLSREEGQAQLAQIEQVRAAEIIPLSEQEEVLLAEKPNGDAFGLSTNDREAAYRKNLDLAGSVDKFMGDGDLWGLQNATNQQKYANELKSAYDIERPEVEAGVRAFKDGDYTKAAGTFSGVAGGLLKEAAAKGIDNPMGLSEFIAEQIPNLIVGAKVRGALAATNVGYGAGELRKSLEATEATSKAQLDQILSGADVDAQGALVNNDELLKRVGIAVAMSAAEQFGETSLLKGFTKSGRAANRTEADGILQRATQRVAGKTAGKAVGAVAKAAGVAAKEGLTEGFQTAGETDLLQGNRDLGNLSGREIFAGAAIGAAVGGALGAGQQATAGIGKKASQAAVAVKANQARKQELDAAVETGDMSAALAVNHPKYDVAQSLETLARRSSVEGVSTEERQQLKAQGQTLIEQELDKEAELSEKLIQLRESKAPSAEIRQAQAALAQSEQRVDAAVERFEQLKTAVAPTVAEINSDNLTELAKAREASDTTVAQTQATTAAKTLVESDIVNPGALTETQLDELSKDELVPLAQRTYFAQRKAVAAEVAKAKDLSLVSEEVLVGGGSKPGLQAYQERIGNAIAQNQPEKAQQLLDRLATFSSNHQAKLAAVEQAYAPFAAAREQGLAASEISLDEAQTKAIADVAQNYQRLDGKGGLEIGPQSGRLVEAVAAEAAALRAGEQSLRYLVENSQEILAAPVVDNAAAAPVEAEPAPEVTEQAAAPVEPESAPAVVEQAEVPAETTVEPVAVQEDGQADEELTVEQEATPPATNEMTEEDLSDGMPSLGEDPAPDYDLVQSLRRVPDNDPTPEKHLGNFVQAGKATLLRKMDNFNRRLREQGPAAVEKALDRALSDQQQSIMSDYAGLAEKMEAAFYDQFDYKDRAYFDNNLLNYFVDPDNDTLEANMLSAMTAAGYNWLLTGASSSLYNDPDAVKAMLGRPEHAPRPTNRELEILRYAGIHQSVLSEQLGRNALAIAGFHIDVNAPGNIEAKLTTDIGNMIMVMMAESGLITRQSLTKEEVAELTGVTGRQESWPMWRADAAMEVGTNGTLAPRLTGEVATTVLTNAQSNGFFQRVFDTETKREFPGFAPPVAPEQRKMKGTDQVVPKEVAEALAIHEQRAHSIRPETDGVFMDLSREAQLTIMGHVNLDQLPQHIDLMDSATGGNLSLERELDNYLEYRGLLEQQGKGLATPFYFQHEAWKQLRLGMVGNTVNPQSSKFHRAMIQMNDWKTEVPLGDENHPLMQQFYLAVGEAFGVGNDRLNEQAGLDQAMAKLELPEIRAGIDAIKQQMKGTAPDNLEAVVLAAVAKGGEKAHSLNGLVEFAKMELAAEAGQGSFTTGISRELDGITNGPIIGLLQFMAAANHEALKALLNRGGVFFDGTTQSYGEWLNQAMNLDNYQALAKEWREALVTMSQAANVSNGVRKAMSASAVIFSPMMVVENGELIVTSAGRKIAKLPLLTMVYGSGIKAIKEQLADAFIETILSEITARANKAYPGMTPADQELARVEHINEYVATVNTAAQGPALPVFTSTKQALETRIAGKQQAALRNLVKDTYGTSVGAIIKERFKEFTDRRTTVNDALIATHAIFKTLYDHAVEKRTAELRAEGLLGEKDVLPKAEDRNIRAALQQAQPLIHGYFSSQSGDLQQALYVGKQESQAMTGDSRYRSQTSLTSKMRVKDHDGNWTTGAKSLQTYGRDKVDTNPGVGTTILSIHGLDAAGAASIYKKFAVLGVHDGFPTGLHQVKEVGKALNKDFFDIQRNFSIAEQAEATLTRAIEFSKQYMRDNKVDLRAQVTAQLSEEQGEYAKSMSSVVTDIRNTRDLVAEQKPAFMDQITHLLQYNVEGGGHSPEASTAPSTAPVPSVLGETRERTAAENKAWPVDEEAKTLLEGEAVTPVELLRAVWKKTRHADAGITRGMNLLAEAVGKQLVNADTKVVLVRRSSRFPEMAEETLSMLRNSRAMFDAPNNTLYVKSDEFTQHGLSVETLLHEMLHVATTQVLRQGDSAQAVQARSELNTLLSKLQKKAQESGVADQFATALDNTDELIAWGLTNVAFQTWLKSVKVAPQSRVKANGFKQLLDKLLLALTGRTTESAKQISALEQVAEATVVLLEEAGTVTDTTASLEPLAQSNPQMDSQTLFEKLGQGANTLSQEHLDHLSGVLDEIVIKAQGPYGARVRQYRGQTDTADQFLQAMADKDGHVLSRVLGAGFRLSPQEAYVYEQVEAVTRATLDTHGMAAKELTELHKRVKQHMESLPVEKRLAVFNPTGADLRDPANAGYLAEAQRRYDLVFSPEVTGSTTQFDEVAKRNVTRKQADYLHHFLALGQAHSGMRQLLSDISGRVEQSSFRGGTILQKLEWIMRQLLNRLVDWELGTAKTGNAQQRLDTLARQLAGVDNRREMLLLRKVDLAADKASQVLDKAAEVLRKNLQAIANNERLKNSKNAFVQAGRTAANSVTDNAYAEQVNTTMRQLINRASKGQQSMVASVVDEMRGMRDGNRTFYRMLRLVKTQLEKSRQQVTDWTHDQVSGAFAAELSEEAAAGITKALLKTELFHLMEENGIPALDALLKDPAARAAKIVELEAAVVAAVPKGIEANYLLNPVDFLGHYMATGEIRSPRMQFNVESIAAMVGIQSEQVLGSQEQAAVVPLLKQLAAVRALNYTAQQHLDQVSELVRQEAAREDGQNGITFVLNLHRDLHQQALEDAFGNDPRAMIMGYTREVVNQNISFEVASAAEEQVMLARGYVKHGAVARDARDPDGDARVLYVAEEGGLPRRVSGIASLTGQVAKGSRSGAGLTRQEVERIAKRSEAEATQLFKRRVSPLSMSGTKMAPLQRPDGTVTDWRYMMSEANKDDILQKRNNAAEVLGAMAGNLVDKKESGRINQEMIKAFHDEFLAGYAANPEDYLEVSAKSSDPQLAEIWAMLPKSAKHSVKQTWGREQMFIRKDLLNIGFGYRKWTPAEIWEKEGKGGVVRKAAHDLALRSLSPGVRRKVMQAERAVREGVALAKDFLVIRSVGVMVGNILSNMTVLAVAKVPLDKMIKYQREGYVAIQDLMRDEQELFKQQQELKLGANQTSDHRRKLAQRIAELENSIGNNPAKELVDAGLFPSIIEDVEQDRDPFSFQSKWMESLDQKTGRLPPALKETTNLLLMGRNTSAYRFLSRTTQISDFVARYAMHKHMTTRKNKPLTREASIDLASDAFVNYDIPTHRGLQAANDYGFLIFTRYYLRIQKVIWHMMRENPGQFAMVAMMQSWLNMPSVMDSSMFVNGLGNRLSDPISLMMDAPGEIATLDLVGEMLP